MCVIGYVDALMALVFMADENDLATFRSVLGDIRIPPTLSASSEKPSMEEAVDRHVQRFSK